MCWNFAELSVVSFGVARGTSARKTPATSNGAQTWGEMDRVHQQLSNSVYKILLGRFGAVIHMPRGCTKSGLPEVDH